MNAPFVDLTANAGSHSLWLDLRIGSEDPPACQLNAPPSITEV